MTEVEMETWKVIEGFENYEVSDLGRVRRITAANGTKAGKVLKPIPKPKSGRLRVYLMSEGKRYTKSLHILVARAFIPNPSNLPEVNHLGAKTDCRAAQLEWRSKRGNILHAMQNNLCKGDGVYFIKDKNKWEARYSPKPNHEVHIGCFST